MDIQISYQASIILKCSHGDVACLVMCIQYFNLLFLFHSLLHSQLVSALDSVLSDPGLSTSQSHSCFVFLGTVVDTGGGSEGSVPPYQTLGVFCLLYYPQQNHLQNPPKCTFQSLNFFFCGRPPKHPPSRLYYCCLLPKIFLQSTSHFRENPGTPYQKILVPPLGQDFLLSTQEYKWVLWGPDQIKHFVIPLVFRVINIKFLLTMLQRNIWKSVRRIDILSLGLKSRNY